MHARTSRAEPFLNTHSLAKANLRTETFEFNRDFYLQIKGTAMGKKFAPAYANIFMAEWEHGALQSCPKRPLHYYRFLDDVWGVWTHTGEHFKIFLHHLHHHNPSIKLKANADLQSVEGPEFKNTFSFR